MLVDVQTHATKEITENGCNGSLVTRLSCGSTGKIATSCFTCNSRQANQVLHCYQSYTATSKAVVDWIHKSRPGQSLLVVSR